MKDETVKATVAMGCITALCSIALFMGQNGVVLGAAIGILSGLGGYFAAKRG